MAEKRGKATVTVSDHEPPPPQDGSLPVLDPELARIWIRQRWEFASVLNFLHVFKPLIESDLKISAEEIETALITSNADLARLHVALLKGIPPVNRNIADADVWVTTVCRKLATWWPWVAVGENPLKVDHGKEIQRYKELDPINRVLILKALCEVRAQQGDVLRHIRDELKKGTKVTTFRKENICHVGNGVTYWYDGDPVIGHRLYKQVVQLELKHKSKGKGCAAQPANGYKWETVATELVDFQKISDNLSSSKIKAEAALGEIIKTELVPSLMEMEKKKERALKRQQRRAQELNATLNYARVGITRSCRERKPVRYTFDEYDRSIDEALEASTELKTTGSKKKRVEQATTDRSDNQCILKTDEIHESPAKHENVIDEDDDFDENDEERGGSNIEEEEEEEEEEKERGRREEEEEEEGNIEDEYDGEEAEDDDATVYLTSSDAEKNLPKRNRNNKTAANVLAVTKKRLRQRPTCNSAQIVSDSEESLSENGKNGIVSDSEMEYSGDASD